MADMHGSISHTMRDSSTSPGLKVLMVEDDVCYFKFVNRLLASHKAPSFEAKQVRSLASCLAHLASESPDVILLDLGLPDCSGLDSISKIVETGCGAPIIILTASEDNGHGMEAVKRGAQDYLQKHLITNDALIRSLSYAIERRRFEESKLRLAAIQDFVSALAHDLKIPLVGANNVLDAMLMRQFGTVPELQLNVLQGLKDSSRNQLVLVDRLLEIYRYEAGNPNLTIEALDFDKLIHKCVSLITKERQDIEITTSLPDQPLAIFGDPYSLQKLIMNLLDNAVKYGEPNCPISVSVQMDDGMLDMQIHNQGKPIPTEIVKRQFQNFWQGIPGKTYVPHTGLGLYLCQRIATLHHGRITCKTQDGNGTTISVRLPIAQ